MNQEKELTSAGEKIDRPTLPFDSDEIIALRKECQKPRALEDIWTWYILRRVSIYCAKWLSKTAITPNAISWMSLFFFFMTGMMMIFGTGGAYLLAALFYNLGYMADCVDGEVARIKGITSQKGAFLDTLIRAMSIPMLTSFALPLSNLFGQPITLEMGMLIYLAVLVSTMALLVPLSFHLVQAKAAESDPVTDMRKNSWRNEWIAFLTGLPGFFAMIVLVVAAEAMISIPLTSYLIVFFLLILLAKTMARLYFTISALK
ncbi:CDP-alcohol phosphatidyltransferase family protein [Mechercharimyces sp. CAU 1602]|uniref:CDP-alcohol phosphatidyltransferase family protein n=1 Tax=Mechercharimyces sp. CAU 1602 TaxID=2973933 RepID=UPI002161CD9C|nr:CDP-alcohol phosphatidyltransferase family protein [Mechercharimyces sp. CAU 1602]MCS1352009.1 CDP-alcohol phosphatidyltransferase family protein [Mechercharimyces sp. CAU 1602]